MLGDDEVMPGRDKLNKFECGGRSVFRCLSVSWCLCLGMHLFPLYCPVRYMFYIAVVGGWWDNAGDGQMHFVLHAFLMI